MADLIDRAALLEQLESFRADEKWRKKRTLRERWLRTIGIDIFAEAVKRFQTVDAAEVKHGHWQEYEDYCLDVYYDCSVCGSSFYMADGTPTENGYNFCPKCGARLDGTIRIEVEDDATD